MRQLSEFINNINIEVDGKRYEDVATQIGKLFGSEGEAIGTVIDIFTKDITIDFDNGGTIKHGVNTFNDIASTGHDFINNTLDSGGHIIDNGFDLANDTISSGLDCASDIANGIGDFFGGLF